MFGIGWNSIACSYMPLKMYGTGCEGAYSEPCNLCASSPVPNRGQMHAGRIIHPPEQARLKHAFRAVCMQLRAGLLNCTGVHT
jgi:hypothetical protein